jgi:hypothetical protein
MIRASSSACLLIAAMLTNSTPAEESVPVRLASEVSGHIHPAICRTKQGTLVVIFGQSDMRDLRLTRSSDGGKTWSEPTPFAPSIDQWIYPGSLTTLADGRVVHAWNRWITDDKNEKRSEPRWVVYSISGDDGATWGKEHTLPKNDAFPRIVRHPLVELGPERWIASCSDAAIVVDPRNDSAVPFADGRTDPQNPTRAVVPIVRTPKGSLISGYGLRSTDAGKTWQEIKGMPDIRSQGWRHDLVCLPNGWLLASEVLGEGFGGDRFRYVVSHDDGLTWAHYVDFHNPGRPIGGRACPRAVQVDDATVGIVFYDIDKAQPGGPGVFFLRLPLAKFGPKS